jgi:cytochrome c oxidase cbb3-type subunit 3
MKAFARSAFAALLLLGSLACQRPETTVPETTVMDKDVMDFKVLFQQNCSGCHGAEGRDGPGRNLNDSEYLALIPKETLRHVIENGRPGTAMPAFALTNGGPLYALQITALVEGIESEWAKPVHFAGVTPPPYSAEGEPGNPETGKALFRKICFSCHGPGAAVGPVTGPEYLNLVSDQWLRTSIIAGRSDLGMADWRSVRPGSPLSNAEISDLAAYLSSLRPSQEGTYER